MGCCESKDQEDYATTTPHQRPRQIKTKKPAKRYEDDPKYQTFLELDAVVCHDNPKESYITRQQVAQALAMNGISVEGDGEREFLIMDADFRGHVRFKDFCKFVKNWRKGKAYQDSDSSASTSDMVDDVLKEQWK